MAAAAGSRRRWTSTGAPPSPTPPARIWTATPATPTSTTTATRIPTAIAQHITTQTDTLNVSDVDISVVRLFTARIETGEFDSEARVPWVRQARASLGGTTWVDSNANNAMTETPARLAQARASADQSIVLLKNSPAATGAAAAAAA